MKLMEEIAARALLPGVGFEWTAMSYQEKLVGNQMFVVFGLALLLVYLVPASNMRAGMRRPRSFSPCRSRSSGRWRC